MKHIFTFLLMVGLFLPTQAQSNLEFTSSCDFTTFCNNSNNCDGALVQFLATATTDCSAGSSLIFNYQLDKFNDGSIDQISAGAQVNQNMEMGEHRLIFTVSDQCNSSQTCEFTFEVKDCKKPTPICIFGIASVIMPNTGSLTVFAQDFNNGSFDNCTEAADLKFSFSSDPNDISWTILCSDVGNDGLVPFELHITDEAGNSDFCSTFLNVQDPTNVCMTINPPISGLLSAITPEGDQLENVLYDINGVTVPGSPAILNIGDVITPFENQPALNGVTTFDVVLIHRHILNVDLLDEPWQLTASDINESNTITLLDVTLIRALILGLINEFPSEKSWTFEPSILEVDSTINSFEFLGIKLGDVNGTAGPFLQNDILETRTHDGVLQFFTPNKNIEKGNTYTIPMYAYNFENIIGGQFTLEFDSDALDFQSVQSNFEDMKESNFGLSKVEEGIILSSWNSTHGKNIDDKAPIYNITFTAKRNGILSNFLSVNSAQLVAEAYAEENGGFDFLDLTLSFEESKLNNTLTIHPNPFIEKTTLNFPLENEGMVSLEVYDVNGRLVLSQQEYLARGNHQINISKKDLISTGLYFFQLKSDTQTWSGKLIAK